jgi:hypothetical protein
MCVLRDTTHFVDCVPTYSTPERDHVHVQVGAFSFSAPLQIFREATELQQALLRDYDAAERRRVVPIRGNPKH